MWSLPRISHVPLGFWSTASTESPPGAAVFLVRGDHGDIIGHTSGRRQPPIRPMAFMARTTLLRSNAGFDDRYFKTVWEHVFDFAANR